jgi:hypothetical protein
VRIETTPDGGILLAGLDIFLVELLRQIPDAASAEDSAAVGERLFSPPAAAEEEQFLGEWSEFVQPGLRQLFESSMETVKGDLVNVAAQQDEDSREFGLRLPAPHIDAWLNALNQARVALAARHGFTGEEMDSGVPAELTSRRELALLQVQFYGYIQECLLHLIHGT